MPILGYAVTSPPSNILALDQIFLMMICKLKQGWGYGQEELTSLTNLFYPDSAAAFAVVPSGL